MRPEIRERVERGAALLDEKAPGWQAKINPDGIYMGNTCDCIVGQLYGGFRDGCEALGLSFGFEPDWGQAVSLGFEASETVSYNELRSAWLEYLGHVQLPQETPA